MGLKDLLIKPVQRIPRYMLFVKDIIKYTSHTHSDNLMLQQGLVCNNNNSNNNNNNNIVIEWIKRFSR